MSHSDESRTALSPDVASSAYSMLWGRRSSPASAILTMTIPHYHPLASLAHAQDWTKFTIGPPLQARRPGMVHTAIGSASNCDSPLDLFPPLQSNFTSNGNLSTFQFSNSIATKRKPVAAPTTTQLPGDSPLSSRFVSLFSHSYSTGASSPYTPMLSTRPPSSTVDSHPHSTVYSGLEPDFDPRLVFPPTIESLNPAVSSWDRSYSSNPSSQDFTVVFGTSTSFNPGTGHSRLGAFTSPVLTQAVRSAFATLVDQTGVSSMNVSLESGSGEKSSDSREPFSFELHSEQTHFVNTRQ